MSGEQIETLLNELHAAGIQPTRVCADSRAIQAGDVFLAYPGHAADGRRYIRDAISRGAIAVLWERDGFEWDKSLTTPNVAVDHLQQLAGTIADEVFGHPSHDLLTVGVTGTNGKTSVSQWIARAYNDLGKRCAVVGTLGMGFPGKLDPSANTTPDAVVLQERLAQFVAQGAQAVTMEVSSIGLDQGRINGCHIDIAVLTNLTRDHLDYHHTMDAYGVAKGRLFVHPGLRAAVLNFDDMFGAAQARRLQGSGVDVIGYTLVRSNALVAPARHVLVADNMRNTTNGMTFVVDCEGQRVDMSVGLVGQFNVSNLLAVIATLMQSGYTMNEAVQAARALTPPEGRMQTVGGIGEPLVVVDYAHTPDALEQALLALRSTVTSRGGRLMCVFGCGGDRDPGKRPLMGEVAQRLADDVIVTSDNPRNEDPAAIVADIVKGIPQARTLIDRADAIRHAVLEADADDVVLVAGKGHENYQEIGRQRTHFSDVEQAREALLAWNSAQRANDGEGRA